MTLGSLKRRVILGHPTMYSNFRSLRGWTNARRRGIAQQGKGSYITSSALVHRDTHLDDYAFVGPNCHISVPVTIGRYSMLAPHVAIVGADHVFTEVGTPIIFAGRPVCNETVIGSDVWLGYGVIVLAGVRIGDCTIVGAGSVVTKDLPDSVVCVGNPARVVRSRFASEIDSDRHRQVVMGDTRSGKFADPR